MYPQAEISNGSIQAKVYLPDPENGYYRATRFDWSGVLASLKCQGHEYFGPWFERHDPKIHDAVVGPAEEFDPDDGGLGYREAGSGGTFVRIGVGIIRKPDESAYRRFGTYDIVDPGKWTVCKVVDCIEFCHEVTDGSGYAYLYRKTIRLSKNRSQLSLQHSLMNTGQRSIKTTQYNHNFFVIDGLPAGPDFVVRFPFEPRPTGDLKGFAQVRGRQLVYLRELQKGHSILSPVQGFGNSAHDHHITLENHRTGAGVRILGDQALSNLVFWSIRTAVCPEPYVTIRVEPGSERSWKTEYEFYSIPISERKCIRGLCRNSLSRTDI
jgi:hypothetical protein